MVSVGEAGVAGLRWTVAQEINDTSVYDGAAGVLRALCEARLNGITEFDSTALDYRDQLLGCSVIDRDPSRPLIELNGTAEDTSLYMGAAGRAAALRCWAEVTGDEIAAAGAVVALREVARAQLSPIHDLLLGDAGALLELLMAGALDAAGRYADALVECGERSGSGLDWRLAEGFPYLMPNFSHGTAGVAFALARAAVVLERPDLGVVARAGADRLVELGRRPDGTMVVPHSIPQQERAASPSWGWCHGPTGTVRLFLQLAGSDSQWRAVAEASLDALRGSGVPERLYPGFWDNHGQCCGTAGVGEMALDRYQATGERIWLDWADELAVNLVAHAVPLEDGLAWSNLEYRKDPPLLPPEPGWMQGAAGIASFLLRTERVHRDGVEAVGVRWPDRP